MREHKKYLSQLSVKLKYKTQTLTFHICPLLIHGKDIPHSTELVEIPREELTVSGSAIYVVIRVRDISQEVAVLDSIKIFYCIYCYKSI